MGVEKVFTVEVKRKGDDVELTLGPFVFVMPLKLAKKLHYQLEILGIPPSVEEESLEGLILKYLDSPRPLAELLNCIINEEIIPRIQDLRRRGLIVEPSPTTFRSARNVKA